MESQTAKPTRGGARVGAGRKPAKNKKPSTSTAIRVDDRLLSVITTLKAELQEHSSPFFYHDGNNGGYEIMDDSNLLDFEGKKEMRENAKNRGLSVFELWLDKEQKEQLNEIIELKHMVGNAGGCTTYTQVIGEILRWGLKVYPEYLKGCIASKP